MRISFLGRRRSSSNSVTRRALSLGFGMLVSCGALLACSLSRQHADCTSTSECRDAFGPGFVCAEDGLCRDAAVEPRCLTQVPSDLLLAPSNYRDYVVLGSLLRTAGKERARQDSAYLAIDAVNRFIEQHEEEYPQLAGLRFGYVQCDHGGNVDEAAELAHYLVDVLEAPAIIGPASSSASSAAFSAVNLDGLGNELRKTLFVSPSATSVALQQLESSLPGMLWRTAPTDDGQGKLMGQYALEQNMQFIALYEDTPYGRGLYEQLAAETGSLCDDCGFSFDASSSELDSLAATLASNKAVAALQSASTIFFMGAQETHLKEMIRRLAEPEFAGKQLFFSDAGASADTVSHVASQDADRVVGTRPKTRNDGETLRVFQSIYEARYDESPLIHSFTANSYDAAWLVLLSALRARLAGDAITPASLAEGLTRISDPNWTSLNEQNCPGDFSDGVCQPLTLDVSNMHIMLAAFEEFGAIDVQGASGDLDYNPETEELLNAQESFEFWHLEPETSDDVAYSIVSGTTP